MESQKRSRIVGLTMVGLPLGTIALANAFPGHEMRRNLYPDRAACERDYSPQQCAADTSSSSSSSGYHGGWHGPYYAANRAAAAVSDPGPGRAGQATSTQASMRGGFGSFGHAFGGGRA